MIDEDEDPTIISNILEEFRANANNYHRSSMLPMNVAHDKARARRLQFEDSRDRGTSEMPDKKLKLTTPRTSEISRSSNVMSPWEIRRLKSEAIKFKTQVIEAEERINKLEGLKLETELHYAREKKAMEDALKQERTRVSELENRISFIRIREAEAIEKYSQLKFSENNKESSHHRIMIDLQKENHSLKEQIYELRGEIENHKKQEKDEINSCKSEIALLKSKEEMNDQLIETLRQEVSEKNNELRKLEVEQTKILNATKRLKDLEMEVETYKETRAYVDLQSKKLLRYSELEKEVAELKEENKRLKSSMSNTLYLEEVVEDLKTRQKATSSLEQEIFKLRSENQNSRIELENWSNLAKHYCNEDSENFKPSILIKRRLEELVRKELWYVSENKNLEIKTDHLKERVAEKENEILKLKEQVETLKADNETHVATTRRLKKQLSLVSWERNDLRKLVDSCQKDMTITPEIQNQFEALQKLIDGYKERTAKIENDASLAFSGTSSTLATEIGEFQKKEVNLKEQNKKLLEKVQQLSDQLEYRHLKGDFDPRQTKIIHLKSNPTSEAVQNYEDRLTKANEEIRKLKERIKVMEEGNSADVTRIVEERIQTSSSKEINDLKEQVNSLALQKQRLCEVFKKRTHDFRDAMYMLFGYKIDVLGTNQIQYRLCNQYSFDSEDILLFQISDGGNGTMELLETQFSQTLSEFIDLHLKQHKSIPLFLSSLTVDLFNKQTITSFSTSEATICDD